MNCREPRDQTLGTGAPLGRVSQICASGAAGADLDEERPVLLGEPDAEAPRA